MPPRPYVTIDDCRARGWIDYSTDGPHGRLGYLSPVVRPPFLLRHQMMIVLGAACCETLPVWPRAQVQLSRTPGYWKLPSVPLGTHQAVWAHTRL
jgi:hypothetical protein